jgi:aminobenzoyl-glutamate utilization protein B
MNLAARVLASSAWDLYEHPETLTAAKAELQRRLGDQKYESLMRPGQKPPLDYRNAPRAKATESSKPNAASSNR